MKDLVRNEKLRNIAIIAHVDHGKTTLVDALFRQSGIFRSDQQVDDRVMDSMDLERERGITISAKNCAVSWNGVKINIIDTPGHADFGGEVERALSMADGAILLVDAAEGPLPQTRFVLRKALERGLKIIVVVNKIDRKDARAQEVLNEVYDLFIDLDATEEQLEFPVLYAIGRDAVAMRELDAPRVDLSPLFETILEVVPGPSYDPEEPFQMLVSDLDYSEYLGRLAVGRSLHGTVRSNEAMVCVNEAGVPVPLRVTRLQAYEGLRLVDITEAMPGDIVIIAGMDDVAIGDTICTKENIRVLPRLRVDEPTVAMRFTINTSPLAGREGKNVQSRKIRDRLLKEALINVAIKIEEPDEKDSFIVKGRGEFQMAILIETMRREDFELCVGRPEVIFKRDENGQLLEPIEQLYVDCDENFMGVVTDKIAQRKGRMVNCVNNGTGRVRLEFSVPSRGLIGYRSELLTATKGTGIMNHVFDKFEPFFRGDFSTRSRGSLVAHETGESVAYGLFNSQDRGTLFIGPGEKVYQGMVVGECSRGEDIVVNVCKRKQATNMRAAGSDDALRLTTPKVMSLEESIEFLADDELLEVTPNFLRIRKRILDTDLRAKEANRLKKMHG